MPAPPGRRTQLGLPLETRTFVGRVQYFAPCANPVTPGTLTVDWRRGAPTIYSGSLSPGRPSPGESRCSARRPTCYLHGIDEVERPRLRQSVTAQTGSWMLS